MADEREVFSTTENGSNQGVPLSNAVDATTAAAALDGAVGFSFKNSAGAVVLPALNASGQLPVALDAGTPKSSRAEDATGSTSLIDLSGSEIVLTLTKVHSCIAANVSCSRDTLFQIVATDDTGGAPVETILGDCIVGAGQYSFKIDLGKALHDTTGGTGLQDIKIKYQNFNKESTVRASLSLLEAL